MMKDYVNHRKKRQGQTRKATFWFVLVIVLAMAAGLSFYAFDKHGVTMASFKEMSQFKIASYLPQVFNKDKQPPETKKAAHQAPEVAKPIHFAFYDELPKAQLDYKPKVEEEVMAAAKEVESPSVEPQSQPAVVAAKTLSSAVSEKSIEQELSEDLSSIKNAESSPYILQIGIFHNLEAANRYRSALQGAGLKVDVVKAKLGREVVYRLQQGPYTSQDQLKAAKKRLTERGVTSDIRKLSQIDA